MDHSQGLYIDWKWILFFGVLFSFFLLFVLLAFGAKVALAAFIGSLTLFSSFFIPEAPLLLWAVLVISEPFMTGYLNLGAGVNLTNIFLILVVVGYMLRCAVERKDPFPLSKLNIAIAIIVIMAILSFIRGSSYFGYSLTGENLNQFKRFLTTFIVMFLSSNMFESKKSVFAFAFVVLLTLLYEIRVVFIQHGSVSHWHYSHAMRIKGTFEGGGGANELGSFLVHNLAMVFAVLANLDKKWIGRILLLIVLILGIMAVQYSYSRAAYLGMIIAVLVVSFLKSRRLFAVVLIAGVVSYPLWPVSVRERFSSIEHEDKSIHTRKEIWKMARGYIVQSPVIGYGYNASSHMLPRDTHNMYYDIALEMGLPALFAVWYLLWVMINIGYRLYKCGDDWFAQTTGLALLGSTLTVAFGNMFGTRLGYFPINMHWAILAGIGVVFYRRLRCGEKDSS